MTHKERMTTVLRDKKIPDKVPHGDLMIWPELIDELLGGETFSENEKMNYLYFWMSETMSDHFFERDKKVREMLGFDWTHVLPGENWQKTGKDPEGHDTMKDPYGVEHSVTPDSVSMAASPIPDIKKADKYNLPSVKDFSFKNLERWVKDSDLYVFL